MNARSNLLALLVAASSMLAFAPAQAGEKTDGAAVNAAQIEAAHTPADHEAIARSYEEEAVQLERKAQAHEAMAKVYRSGGGAPKGHAPSMVSHCDKLVAQYRGAAQEARALAAEHRAVAGASGK